MSCTLMRTASPDFLHAAFEDVGHAELLRDLGQVARLALILLGRSARDHFQVRDLRQPRQDFVLDAAGEILVRLVFAQTRERQHGDAL